MAVVHVPLIPLDDLAFRVGNPTTTDVVLGGLLILVLLEATRRSVGWPLPIISILFMLYALYGPSMPGILVHPGATFSQLVNHLYLTTQGIYGIALGVVATYVFHFVLFGVLLRVLASASSFSTVRPGLPDASPAARPRCRSSARPCLA